MKSVCQFDHLRWLIPKSGDYEDTLEKFWNDHFEKYLTEIFWVKKIWEIQFDIV